MKITVLSHLLFDEEMKKMNLNDLNIDDTNIACISIIGTEPCLRSYLEEPDTKHYFNNSHDNVLNLEFDDLEKDIEWKGETFKAMSEEQAKNTLAFIERMIDNNVQNVYIHCRAGMSRSRAIAEFIYRLCRLEGKDVEYGERNDYIQLLNYGVLSKLNHALMEKELKK